jgi:hypothetical protein
MTAGLEFEVVAVETRTDSTREHMKQGEVVAPWPIETITLRLPFNDEGFTENFRVANMSCPYYVGDNGTFSVQIVDPGMQGKLKIGDRVDLLKALTAK